MSPHPACCMWILGSDPHSHRTSIYQLSRSPHTENSQSLEAPSLSFTNPVISVKDGVNLPVAWKETTHPGIVDTSVTLLRRMGPDAEPGSVSWRVMINKVTTSAQTHFCVRDQRQISEHQQVKICGDYTFRLLFVCLVSLKTFWGFSVFTSMAIWGPTLNLTSLHCLSSCLNWFVVVFYGLNCVV